MEQFKDLAEPLGAATFVFILVQVVAGLLRPRLGTAFTWLHRGGAALMLVAAATHGGLLFLKVGPPDTAWHACGSLAAAAGTAALLTGVFRSRLGPRFLGSHRALGLAALVLAVLHRALSGD